MSNGAAAVLSLGNLCGKDQAAPEVRRRFPLGLIRLYLESSPISDSTRIS
jgi:hypothetical protein